MRFSSPLVGGTLVRRYRRFLADVRLDTGEEVTVACPNTGSMAGVSDPGFRVWLSSSSSPKRKYPWTWELVEVPGDGGGVVVGINPQMPNRLVRQGLLAGFFAPLGDDFVLEGGRSFRAEVPYGTGSRVDFVLEGGGARPCFLEVKNVHLSRRPGHAEFPDAPTQRGARHLGDLAAEVEKGARAMVVYVVQREDCTSFSLARDIDPGYAQAWDGARRVGVEAYACVCRPSVKGIDLCGFISVQ